jgi:ankyrin repeat protein
MDSEDEFLRILEQTREVNEYELCYAALNGYLRAVRYLVSSRRISPTPWTLLCAARSSRDFASSLMRFVEEALAQKQNRMITYYKLTEFNGYPTALGGSDGGSEVVEKAITAVVDSMSQAQKDLALSYSVGLGDTSMVRLLVRYGANVNQQTRSGKTILSIGVENCGAEGLSMVKILMEAGANHGDALRVARQKGREDIVAILQDVRTYARYVD